MKIEDKEQFITSMHVFTHWFTQASYKHGYLRHDSDDKSLKKWENKFGRALRYAELVDKCQILTLQIDLYLGNFLYEIFSHDRFFHAYNNLRTQIDGPLLDVLEGDPPFQVNYMHGYH